MNANQMNASKLELQSMVDAESLTPSEIQKEVQNTIKDQEIIKEGVVKKWITLRYQKRYLILFERSLLLCRVPKSIAEKDEKIDKVSSSTKADNKDGED